MEGRNKRRIGERLVKIAICGYYGHSNFGDEAMLEAILCAIDRVEERRRRMGEAVRADVHILRSGEPLGVLRSLVRSSTFVFGGGSLLQDLTSSTSLAYYMGVIFLSGLFSDYKIMLANGWGPFTSRTPLGALCARLLPWTLERFDVITARDHESALAMQRAVPGRTVSCLRDPALALIEEYALAAERDGERMERDLLLYIPCADAVLRAGISVSDEIAATLREASERLRADLCVAVLDCERDIGYAREICRSCSAPLVEIRSVQELAALLPRARVVLSQRYHGSLFAAVLEAPLVSVSDDPKLVSLSTQLSLALPAPIRYLCDTEALCAALERAEEQPPHLARCRRERACEYCEGARDELERTLDACFDQHLRGKRKNRG